MSTRQGREVAYRLFATEYDDADFEYAESDEERAPNYVVTPTGARANRAFVAGVLTEVTPVGDEEVLRARVADPTGAFVLYAGQYQPEALAVVEEAEPPAFLAVTGKARTFQPDDGERTFTSLRPETITHVDSDVRDHHVVTAAERTIERVDTLALALQSGLTDDALRGALEAAGLDAARADGAALALEHYDTSPAYLEELRERAIQALAVVTGEREEVDALDLAPDANPEYRSANDLPTEFAAVDGPLEPPASIDDATEEPSPGAVDADEGTDAAGETEATATSASVGGDSDGVTDSESSTAAEPAGSAAAEEQTSDSSGDVALDASGDAAIETEAGEETEESIIEEPSEEESSDDVGGFELDDDEREEIESEFPTDFETGNDVDEAGEADIDVPEPEDLAAPEEDEDFGGEGQADVATDPDQPAESTSGASDATDAADAADDATVTDLDAGETEATDASTSVEGESSDATDLEDVVVEHMEALDEGEGVERENLVAAVVDETGADTDAVSDAIDDALMDGRCYAPGDERLKPI
jgi:RPA family protein